MNTTQLSTDGCENTVPRDDEHSVRDLIKSKIGKATVSSGKGSSCFESYFHKKTGRGKI